MRIIYVPIIILFLASRCIAGTTTSVYGTFNCVGIQIEYDLSDDPTTNATTVFKYRKDTDSTWTTGFPLYANAPKTITDGSGWQGHWFVGSAFWLDNGTTYDLQVTFSDPNSDPIDGTVIETSCTTRAESELSTPSAGSDYYVATDGDDTTGTGAIATPFATIGRALIEADAGDEVVLRAGTYYTGDIDITTTPGSLGSPICIRAMNGETVWLDGRDGQTYSWSLIGDGTYETTIDTDSSHTVLVYTGAPQRLLVYTSLANLRNLTYGVSGYYLDSNTTLNVHLVGNIDPATTSIIVSNKANCFNVAGVDYIQFANLGFQYFGHHQSGDYPGCIRFYNANDCLVTSCTFRYNQLGCYVHGYAETNDLVVQDCSMWDTMYTGGWSQAMGKDSGWEAVSGGIRFKAVVAGGMSGRGVVIRRNRFWNFMDGNCIAANTAGWNVNNTSSETDFHDNVTSQCLDDGIEVDGVSVNTRLWNNTWRDCGTAGVGCGISMSPNYYGPTYCLYNLIYGTYTHRPFKHGGAGTHLHGPTFLFHNTGYGQGYAKYHVVPGVLLYSRNNIFATDSTGFYVTTANITYNWDYDNIWDEVGGSPLGTWDGVNYDFTDLQTSQSLETNGYSTNPGWTDAANGDYTLGVSSAMINAGVVVNGINTVGSHIYDGTAPDVGYDEYTETSVAYTTQTLVNDRAGCDYLEWSVTSDSSGVYDESSTTTITGKQFVVKVIPGSGSEQPTNGFVATLYVGGSQVWTATCSNTGTQTYTAELDGTTGFRYVSAASYRLRITGVGDTKVVTVRLYVT